MKTFIFSSVMVIFSVFTLASSLVGAVEAVIVEKPVLIMFDGTATIFSAISACYWCWAAVNEE